MDTTNDSEEQRSRESEVVTTNDSEEQRSRESEVVMMTHESRGYTKLPIESPSVGKL